MALASLLVIAAPAMAKRASTKIVISYSDPYFLGSLRSTRGGCKYGRTLKLYREDFDADELINSGTSDGSGRWKIEATSSAGSNYYVLAPATGGCRPSKSAVLGF
jgi:hypothetical protein